MRRVFFISAVCLATFSAPVYGVKLNDLEDTSIFDSDALYLAELLSLTSSAADPEKSKGFFKGPVASPAETPATKASKKAALKAPVPTAPKVPALAAKPGESKGLKDAERFVSRAIKKMAAKNE